MRYADFTILLAEHPQGFAVNVIESPAGEGTACFDPPFSREELARILGEIRTATGVPTRGPASPSLRDIGTGPPESSPDRVGQKLFDALFQGEVLNLFERSLGRIEREAVEGLRVKILIDPRSPYSSFLQMMPWELLYSARDRDFIALNRKRPIVRYLMAPHRSSPLAFKPPLRILVVASDIADPSLPHLDLERESQNLHAAMRQSSRVELIKPETPTILGVRQALLKNTCHVIHFMGHGTFDQGAGEGALLFQGDGGAPERVNGVALAQVLRDFPSIRLMVLNACNSAYPGGGANPFAGVANALVLSGLPAVVAMQFPITDWAAIDFSKAFYTRLAENDPIDAAVAEGRQAVHARDDRCVDWSAPALFMRSPDGQLFTPAPVEPKKRGCFKKIMIFLGGLAVLMISMILIGLIFSSTDTGSNTTKNTSSSPSTSDSTPATTAPPDQPNEGTLPANSLGQPPAPEPTPADSQSRSTVTVVNNSQWKIRSIYMSSTKDDSWGPDVLENDILFPQRQARLDNIQCDDYDVKLVDETGGACELRQINICDTNQQWVITDSILLDCEKKTP